MILSSVRSALFGVRTYAAFWDECMTPMDGDSSESPSESLLNPPVLVYPNRRKLTSSFSTRLHDHDADQR